MTNPSSDVANRRWKNLGGGVVLGGLAGGAMWALNLNVLVHYFQHLIVAGAVAGGILGLTRARKLLWIVSALLVALLLAVMYTPLTRVLLNQVDRRGEAAPADGVVVLAAGFLEDNAIGSRGQDRLLHSLFLLHQGWAPRLIVTRPADNGAIWPTLVRREMSELGVDYPIEEVGPVRDTHDEAVAIAQLVHQRGWKNIILVTHAWHMRRAAAMLEKLNVQVICSPCSDSSFDETNLYSPSDRLTAFGVWLHEQTGWFAYRMRGWL